MLNTLVAPSKSISVSGPVQKGSKSNKATFNFSFL